MAIHDHKLNVAEVRVEILEVSRSDTHVIGAGIGLSDRPGIGLRRLDRRRHIIQIVVRHHGLVSADGVRLSVVRDFVAVLGNRDRHLFRDRVDLQLAVHDHKLNIAEVRVEVLEVSRNDAHVVRAGIGLSDRPGIGLRRLDRRRHIIQIVVRHHGLVSADGVRLSVVRDFVAVLSDRYRHLVFDRVDLQFTVRHLKRHRREVRRVAVAELILIQTHLIRARIGLRHGSLTCEHDIVLIKQRILGRSRITFRSLRLTIVCEFFLVALDCHDQFIDRRDLQGTFILRDIVVAFIEGVTGRVNDRIVDYAFIDCRYASGCLNVADFLLEDLCTITGYRTSGFVRGVPS